MSAYEIASLILTGIYDLLTFLLLSFVAYETIFRGKIPNIAFYSQPLPEDTERWGLRRQIADFILENRGIELTNITIKSEPDDIGWNNLGDNAQESGAQSKKTSEYFRQAIPYLSTNEKLQFLWCDLEANIEIVRKPFKIIIEYDNTISIIRFFKKRDRKSFPFNFSVFDGITWGVTNKYDIHNVAKELSRIRERLEKCEGLSTKGVKDK